jgi:hypothetical protein
MHLLDALEAFDASHESVEWRQEHDAPMGTLRQQRDAALVGIELPSDAFKRTGADDIVYQIAMQLESAIRNVVLVGEAHA